ncbi:MAG: hypothetical protein ACK2UW_09325 [Anaerolineales bacterium]
MHELSPAQLMKMQIGFDGKFAILLLLARLNRPVQAREVARFFGISEHRAGRHLQQMLDLCWVRRARRRRGYVLVREELVDILAIDAAAALPEPEEPLAERQRSNDPSRSDHDPEQAVNVRIVHQRAAATTFKPQNQTKINQFKAAAAKAAGKSGRVKARTRRAPPPETAARRELLAALAEQGIGEPKRSELAAQPHLDADQVTRWAAALKAQRGERFTTGLLIHVLASGDPAPAARHPSDCRCVECLMGAYLCSDCRSTPCTCTDDCPECGEQACTCADASGTANKFSPHGSHRHGRF